jgi:hypothetical protein
VLVPVEVLGELAPLRLDLVRGDAGRQRDVDLDAAACDGDRRQHGRAGVFHRQDGLLQLANPQVTERFHHNRRGDRAAVDAKLLRAAPSAVPPAAAARGSTGRSAPGRARASFAAPQTTAAMMYAQFTSVDGELEGQQHVSGILVGERDGYPGRGEHDGAGEDARPDCFGCLRMRSACPCAAGGGRAGSGGRAPPTPSLPRRSRSLGGAHHPPVAGRGAVLPYAAGVAMRMPPAT